MGYAWRLTSSDQQVASGSGVLPGTSYYGELRAAIEGLGHGRATNDAVRVHTNNEIICRAGTEWIAEWRARGWRRKGGIKHVELIKELEQLIRGRDISWQRADGGQHMGQLRRQARACAAQAGSPADDREPAKPEPGQLRLAVPAAPAAAPAPKAAARSLVEPGQLRLAVPAAPASAPTPPAAARSLVEPEVVAYTDGGCRGNPGGIGGWGVLLVHLASGSALERRGGEPDTTNNRMELQAVIEALQALSRPSRIEIRTDSTYVRNVCTRWLSGWKAAGWRKRDHAPIKNLDLIRELDRLLTVHTASWKWVRGHAGEPGNEHVDALAARAMTEIRRGGHGRDQQRHAESPIRISAEPCYPDG